MICIPVCLSCKYYCLKKCPAYPDGIPAEVLIQKRRDDGECGNGVKFTKKNK